MRCARMGDSRRGNPSIAARNRPDAQGGSAGLGGLRDGRNDGQAGRDDREIDAAIEDFFAEHNAVPLFKVYPNSTEGGPPFPAVTCISINDEVVHGIPGPRKLVEGDIVSIDTGCKLNGWCGDAAATLPGRARSIPRCSGCWTSPATC